MAPKAATAKTAKTFSTPARRRVAIVASKRIPFMKSNTKYEGIPLAQLMTPVLDALVRDLKLEGRRLGEVAIGALLKSPSERGLARDCMLGTAMDPHTPAFDLERACGSGMEAVIAVANKIALGQIECGIGGGVDTNSNLPLMFRPGLADLFKEFHRSGLSAKLLKKLTTLRAQDFMPDLPRVAEKRTGLSMGEHCERMVKAWKISRADQDQWTLESHRKAAQGYADGFEKGLIVEFRGHERDGVLRADASLEKLSKLPPAFDKSESGTLTAGNSTALTDGAAAVFLASEDYASQHGLPVLAYFQDARAWAVDFVGAQEGLLMAPTYAVAELLKDHKMSLSDFAKVEIHEAFAGQVLCTLNAWLDEEYCQKHLGQKKALGAIDRERINVMGSSLAVGHPFSATGARVTGVLAKLLAGKKGELGLISICTAGGMGVAAILEGV